MSKTLLTKFSMDTYWEHHPLLNMSLEEYKADLFEYMPEWENLIEELYQDGFSISETIEAISLEEEKSE